MREEEILRERAGLERVLKGLKVVIFFGSKRFVTTANTLNVVIDLHVDLNVVGDGARGKS
jgi:hypothetical protein